MTLEQQHIDQSVQQAMQMTEENLRKQLAYCYRIFDYYGLCDLIVTHLSVRVPNEDALLILPFGVSFKEITPDNIVKVDMDGRIIESKNGFEINNNGTTVHRAIYRSKPEVNCIFHTHSLHGAAVSCLEQGFLILDQIGMMFHDKVGHHDFDTLFINDNQQKQLIDDMADNQCMILRNHGLLTVGSTIQEAFWYHYYLEVSCRLQITAMSAGALRMPKPQAVAETAKKYELWKNENSGDIPGDSYLLFEAAKRQVGNLW